MGGRIAVWLTAGLLLLGAALRAAALWQESGNLHADVDLYRAIAEQIANGAGYCLPTGEPTAYRPPLYPLLLAGVLRFGGGSLSIGILQLVLGGATIALTLATGHRLRLGPARFVAGAIVALDPLLIHNTTLVMTETLAAFLAALLLWWMAGYCPDSIVERGGQATCAPVSTWHSLMTGWLLGLCCLCRPTFCAFALLLVGGSALQVFRRGSQSGSPTPASARSGKRLREIALLLAGLACIVGPWAMRNWIVMGRPIATTTHGGYTLLLGHNPVYSREVLERGHGPVWELQSLLDWQASLEERMKSDFSYPRTEVERDRWMYREAWRYIFAQPSLALRSAGSLLVRLWSLTPAKLPDGRGASLLKWGIGGFNLLVFVALAAAVLRLHKAEWTCWWPLAALLLSFTAVHALYWADMRMRAPLIPAIALLAARGVQGLHFRRSISS